MGRGRFVEVRGHLVSSCRSEWAVLDAFEDNPYDLRNVTPASGGPGLAYIWPDDKIRDEDCDAGQFMVRHLKEFADRCARIAPGLTTEDDQ